MEKVAKSAQNLWKKLQKSLKIYGKSCKNHFKTMEKVAMI